jgi:hypothetical protein
MCDINNDNILINNIQENQNNINNNFEKYTILVEQINYHIQRYSKFVDNKYFEEIYSTLKTKKEIILLKDFSKTIFKINNDNDLENFIKYAQQSEKIMENTEGMVGFCKSFSECFVWHIQEIIMKIKNEIKNK